MPIPPKRPHHIADLDFAQGWLLCACGTRLESKPKDYEGLKELHDTHRREETERSVTGHRRIRPEVTA